MLPSRIQRFAHTAIISINCYIILRDAIGYEEFRGRGEVGLCEGSGELGVETPHSLEA